MDAYLTIAEIQELRGEIVAEFQALLRKKALAGKPKALQWEFLRHCFDVLMGDATGDYPCTIDKARNYKFEVSDKLHRHYLSPGPPIRYIFSLLHEDECSDEEMEICEGYPRTNGYLLLVTENDSSRRPLPHMRALLERIVAEAVDARWSVYLRLPDCDLCPLEGIYEKGEGGYNRIRRFVSEWSRDELSISNQYNPSTRQLLNVRIRELSRDKAEVHTKEYWFLVLWSDQQKAYVFQYNETSKHQYFLVRQDDRWLIRNHIFPTPKRSAPGRALNRVTS